MAKALYFHSPRDSTASKHVFLRATIADDAPRDAADQIDAAVVAAAGAPPEAWAARVPWLLALDASPRWSIAPRTGATVPKAAAR